MTKTRKEIAEQAINKYLNEPIKNITQAYYDEFVKENAENSAQVGLKTIVIRREIGRCCDWCSSLAGEYEYGEQPEDFFRRHDYCKCMVLFKNMNGRYTDVWSKKRFESEKMARIAKVKEFDLEDEFTQMSRETLKPYWDKATPGKGKIEIEEGWDKGQNGDAELRYAKNLHQRFGGDIKLLSNSNDSKSPDYQWNGELWEHKGAGSLTSIDNQLRRGIKQIAENPGGVIIERTSKVASRKETYEKIMYRLDRSCYHKKTDVIVFDGDDIFLAIHWEK